jgi:TonB family protein
VHGGIPSGLPIADVALSAPPEVHVPAFVRPGGNIKDPRKIVDARPIYPTIAIAARAEGVVTLEAIISRDGDVTDAKVVMSQPLLDRAALDAVKQWKFTPTTLNGVPVEVHMMVRVNFTLH